MLSILDRHARSTFNRSPLRPRKQNSCPLSGSRRSTSCTCSDRLAKPFLMSVWPVASHTRTPLGTGIMAASTITRRPFHAHNLDSATAQSSDLFRLLRHDHRGHESGNVATPTFAIRLAPGEQQLVGNPMPTRRRRSQPRSRKTLLDYPQLFCGRPSTAAMSTISSRLIWRV